MKSYTVESAITWGLVHDKDYGGFKLPVSLKEEKSIVEDIEKMVKKYKTNKVFYGDSKTVYLKTWKLTKNQKKTLLNAGKQFVDLAFDVEDEPVESKKGKLYIKITLTGLRISAKSEEMISKEEEKEEGELAPKEEF